MESDNMESYNTENVLEPYAEGYMFQCPGCKLGHIVRVGQSSGPNWTFNGSLDKPTFAPSLVVHHSGRGHEEHCHSYITNGKIQFLQDCTHELAGKNR